MKVLLFRKTTDQDLCKGLKVAYKDKAGEYRLTGIISAITNTAEDITEYTVNGANYLADELKLIDNSKAVKVIFAEPQYNYTTSVNPYATDESLKKYFVGTPFNVGAYPKEIFRKCTSIEII
jgi:hypothetical protein